jgi:hypothetical protein
VESFLKEVEVNPAALQKIQTPEGFAAYDKQLQTLEQGILSQKGIDPKTAAYQLDVVGRARQLAGLAKANSSQGAMPMDALVKRLNTAGPDDPLVQQTWDAIGKNPSNKPLLDELGKKFQTQPGGLAGVWHAVQDVWGSMGGTQKVMALGGAALAVVGLINAVSGGGGLTSGLMGGGGLLGLLMSVGGPSGIMDLVQKFTGAFQGGGGQQRTPLAVPKAPGAAPAPATPPAPGAAPGPAQAPATAPRTPLDFKAQITRAMAAGDTRGAVTSAATMFKTVPDGMKYFQKLDGAFAGYYGIKPDDATIARNSNGTLTPQDVAQLRVNWPAIKAQVGQ